MSNHIAPRIFTRCGIWILAALAASLTAFGQGTGAVRINEFMAADQSVLEQNGTFSDWIELRNQTGVAIDLGDWSLTDDLTRPRRFVFSGGTVIPSGGYLLVFCDDLPSGGSGIYTGFGLSGKGDTLALYGPLVAGGVVEDLVTFGLQVADLSVSRLDSLGGGFGLSRPTPLAPNEAVALGDPGLLKINEWSALNGPSSSEPEPDWFELYNPDPRPVDLGGLVFTDQVVPPVDHAALPALSFIAGYGFIQFFADDEASPADNVNFRLGSTSGDQIQLFRPDRVTVIDSVTFGVQTLNISQGRLPDGGANIVFFATNQPTPGRSNFLPLNNVVINEVLSHSDPPLEDAIELLNVSAVPVDISHWWLSDTASQPQKFRIPAGTVLAPGGFVVFYEGGPTGFNPGGTGFSLSSANGDEVYLFSGDAAGNLTGYRGELVFGPSQNGVSLGRYVISTGEAKVTPLAQRTFGVDNPTTIEQFRMGTGLPNSAPRTSPVVISEIHYHPPDILVGTTPVDNALDEFVELCNHTGSTVALFDPAFPTNQWRIRGGIDFDFPPNILMGPGECLLVVNFDPANTTLLAGFRQKFGVPASVRIFGPYQGKLGNGGAVVELRFPDSPQTLDGFVPYVAADRVEYSDSAPWPASPDGTGHALQRIRLDAFGDDPVNWKGGVPTAGTPGSALMITSFQLTGNTLRLCFEATAGQTFSVLSSATLPATLWSKVTDVTASATGLQCVDVPPGVNSAGFFRLVTPAQP